EKSQKPKPKQPLIITQMSKNKKTKLICWHLFLYPNSLACCFPLQIHSFQRKALQMSGVRKGILSVQDVGCPQNITHAGQGTKAGQDEVIHCSSSNSKRDREHWKNNKTKEKTKPKDTFFFFSHLSQWRRSFLCEHSSRKKYSSSRFSLEIIQKYALIKAGCRIIRVQFGSELSGCVECEMDLKIKEPPEASQHKYFDSKLLT
ncbi:hypothetical protein XENORESO_017593, partial [Xenotaenia resolanae]